SDDEDDLRSKLRGLLVTTLAKIGRDRDAQQRCRDLLAALDANGATSSGNGVTADPELISAATTVVAATGDATDFERFVAAFEAATTPQESLRNLYALAEFDDAALIERTCEFAFSGAVRSQNAPYLLGRCIANRHHGARAWTLVRKHWDQANAAFPNPSIIRMVDPVKLLNTPDAVADVQGFFSEHPIKQSANTLAQVLERQQINAAVRDREAERFTATLAD
ncbi:MAG TPA: ERAP1-like C-terminal domain-containing protein, partial [Ilumatobacteraceae bacterium]|nr:ERAP1-like C-terminal domain-containing protein [Ilumatobacteraceae bacterium]